MESLKFVLELQDKISPFAKDIERSLGGVRKSLKDVTGPALKAVDKGISSSAKTIKSFGSDALGFAADAALGLGAAAVAGLATAGGAIAAFGVHHAIEAEKAHLALRTLVGDSKKADDALANVKGLSNFFGSDPREVEAEMTRLVSKGFEVGDALKIIQGAADLGALGNDSKKLVDVFSELQGKGKASAEAVGQLAQAGVDPEKLRKILLGGLASTSGNATKDIENAITAGTIDVAKLESAALQTVSGMTGKALGGLALESSKTLGGLLDQLKTAPDRIFDAANTSGAIEPLTKALGKLVSALNPETATGKKLVAAIEKISTALGSVVDTITDDGDAVGDWIDAISTGIEFVSDVFDGVAKVLGSFFDEFMVGLDSILGPMDKFGGGAISLSDVFGFLAKTFKIGGAIVGVTVGLIIQLASWLVQAVVGIADGLSGFVTWWDHLWRHTVPDAVAALFEWFAGAYDTMVAWGSAIVDGIKAGIVKAWSSLKSTWNDLVSSLPAAVADKLKIASPSKVMMELGGYTVAGFTEGINDNAGDAQSALSALVSPPSVVQPGALSGRGAMGPVTIRIEINGGSAPPEELAALCATEVQRVFERMAVEAGAAA